MFFMPEAKNPFAQAAVYIHILAGVIAAVSCAAALTLLSQKFERLRLLDEFMTSMVKDFSRTELVIILAVGSVAEEFFFRGALLPSFGLAAQAIIFGLLHTGPLRYFRLLYLWSVIAAGFGLLLGWLFVATGTLAAPISAHLAFNAISAFQIQKRIASGKVREPDEIIADLEPDDDDL